MNKFLSVKNTKSFVSTLAHSFEHNGELRVRMAYTCTTHHLPQAITV